MPGMKLYTDTDPQFGDTDQKLAARLVCFYGAANVQVNTGYRTFFSVDKAACDELGVPPWTANGQTITCPTDDGWLPYYVLNGDVEPLNYPSCTEPPPPPAPLPTPTGVTATPGDGQVVVSWTAVPGATDYQIEWTSGGDTGVQPVAGDTTFTFTGLTNGQEYTYRVKAIGVPDESLDSDWSAPVSATPVAA